MQSYMHIAKGRSQPKLVCGKNTRRNMQTYVKPWFFRSLLAGASRRELRFGR